MPDEQNLLIAIDGPAASGKGTLGRRVAEYYGLAYLDTGSLYRAVGYKILSQNLDPEDKDVAVAIASSITEMELKNKRLYDEGVGNAASIVSAIPKVREVLFDFQRDFAKNSKGAVLDGRDIGTVICPEADFKFFITADVEIRAKRRFKQLQNEENSVIYKAVLEDLKRRDDRDSKRAISPLKQADDAVFIDTSQMSVEQAFDKIVSLISQKEHCALKV